MRRRGFLSGLGVAGGAAALGLNVPSPSLVRAAAAATRPRALAALAAGIGVRLTRFERSRVAAAADAPLGMRGGTARLTMDGTVVSCRARVQSLPDRAGGDIRDLEVRFRVLRGRLPDAAVAVTVTLGAWSRDGYLFVPGAVYAGNRFESRHLPYPPLLAEPADIGPHVPPIVSDIPRLNVHPGRSHIALRATDTAAPAVGAYLPGPAAGALILAEPHTATGETGILIEESDDRRKLTVAITAPAVRPDARYTLCNDRAPSTDRGADLEQGREIAVKLRFAVFPCSDVQGLFDRWFEARRDLLGPIRFRHELPLVAGVRLIEERLVADRWAESTGTFLTTPPAALVTAPASSARELAAAPGFQPGADGALALAVPLASLGGAEARARAASVMDLLLKGQTPAGFFRAAGDGTRWWDEGAEQPAARGQGRPSPVRRWVHVGRTTEALHLGLRLVQLHGRLDPPAPASSRPPERWRVGLGRAADALVRLWTRHRQLGQYVGSDTGDIAVGGSSGAALAPAALALATEVLGREAYLEAALAAAEAFYLRFVRAGITIGGAPAALQSPDSRSAAALLESFVTLGEVTGDGVWFARAGDVARQLASWIVAFDAPLPPQSTLGRMRVHTTGAVLVSAQDKWAHPGFAGISGDALLRLYRATGRIAYLELLKETVHNVTQYVASPDRLPDSETRPGWVASPLPLGDAVGPPGEVPPGLVPGAAAASCLTAGTEIPSLYVHPDTGFVFAFDHVEVRVRGRRTGEQGGRLDLTVENPTRFETEVRILAERERDRSRRLGPWPLVGARTVVLGPGAAEDIEIAEADPGATAERRRTEKG